MPKHSDSEFSTHYTGAKAPFVRNPYNYDTNAASDESGIFCDPATDSGRSLTQQQFTQECDPNFVLDRFIKGGDISLNTREPRYGDFTNVPSSYHEALNYVKNAERSFMELPAQIRAKFDNDAGAFVDFVSNPENAEQLHELGLTNPKAPSEGLSPGSPTAPTQGKGGSRG